jgi:hypothetical protein
LSIRVLQAALGILLSLAVKQTLVIPL